MGSKRAAVQMYFPIVRRFVLSEYIRELCHQGIEFDDDKVTELKKVTQARSTMAEIITELNPKGEGIVRTMKYANLQDVSAGFTDYSLEDALCMSNMFLFFPVNDLK